MKTLCHPHRSSLASVHPSYPTSNELPPAVPDDVRMEINVSYIASLSRVPFVSSASQAISLSAGLAHLNSSFNSQHGRQSIGFFKKIIDKFSHKNVRDERALLPPLSSPSTRKESGAKAYGGGARMGPLVSSAKQLSLESLSFERKYRFLTKKIIGKGSSGVIRLARNVFNDKIFAVKEFKKKDESLKSFMKKLGSEYCISSSLHHENIVETYEIIQSGDHWYEVMEYCSGGDLFRSIHKNHIKTEAAISFFIQLLSGIKYLHSLGVAHLDLKPENLLIDSQNHLKIADFGMSRVFLSQSNTKPAVIRDICGSIPYMAPEIFSGVDYSPASSDIWSCAIIYFVMTFHRVPWTMAIPGKDLRYDKYLLSRTRFDPINRLPKKMGDMLVRMLDPDPTSRITIFDLTSDPYIKSLSDKLL